MGKIAASVVLNLFINGYEHQLLTLAHERNSNSNVNKIQYIKYSDNNGDKIHI